MAITIQQVSSMEEGQAGYPMNSSPFSTDEKGGHMSTSTTDSSTKPLNPHGNSPCTTFSFRVLWNTFWSAASNLGRRTSSSSQQIETGQIVRTLESCPRGYPIVAAFLDSDECFSVYRRFGFLQSRLLLDKQDKLRKLEEALDKLDKREAKADEKRPMTTDLPKKNIESRQKLLSAIESEYNSYASILHSASKMMSLNRPSEADYTSVRNFMTNSPPLLEADAMWIRKKEDLITLRAGREHAWLDSGIEKLLRWFHCSALESIFGDEQTRQKSSGEEVYYSRQRINNLASAIITFMVLILLVVPIYLLYHLINGVEDADGKVYATCLGILLVSTLAFSAVLCLFTRAKRHEILAAAAAYCAVLVVFFSNVGTARK